MSSVALYKYYDGGGRTYSVILPTDFASALSYVAASGSEPYLPPILSPRYATYVCTATRQYASIVVTDPFIFANLPSPISVLGETWEVVNAYGQQYGLLPGGGMQVIAGPQGPQGTPGQDAVLTLVQAQIGSDIALTANTTNDIQSLGVLAAGKWVIFAQAQFQISTNITTFSFEIRRGTTTLSAQSQYQATGSTYCSLVCIWSGTANGTDTYKTVAVPNAAGTTCRYQDNAGNSGATQYTAIKIP